MPSYKYTMIFTYFSGITDDNPIPIRLGGWSESYYAAAVDDVTIALFNTLIQKRLGICPRGTVVNKVRIQAVDPAGAAQLQNRAFAAPNTWLSDVPQMALKVQFAPGFAFGGFLREFRGLPDVQVNVGEYSPTAPFTAALGIFLQELCNNVWRARRRDKAATTYQMLSVDLTGAVVMTDPFTGIANGQAVQVLRTINPQTGRKFGYFAKVQSVTDNQHFVIVGQKVRPSNFGTMRRQGIVMAQFVSPDLNTLQAVVRKVGRPFRSYSGRASRRQ